VGPLVGSSGVVCTGSGSPVREKIGEGTEFMGAGARLERELTFVRELLNLEVVCGICKRVTTRKNK